MKKYILDLHTHTLASGHAYSTLEENIRVAKERGIEVLGMSEHGPAVNDGAHEFYFGNIKVVPEYVNGVRILKGAEANLIDENGSLDLSDRLLKNLDYVMASIHGQSFDIKGIEENTRAVINCIKSNKINVLGHPDDDRAPIDREAIIKVAKEYKVLIEINNSSLYKKAFRVNAHKNIQEILTLCKKYNHHVILGTDSHFADKIGLFNHCEEELLKNNFPEELVINSDYEKLTSYYLNKGDV